MEVLQQHTPVESVTLRPQGALVLRDLLDLAPWRVWRGGLRLWHHAPGGDDGTLCASASELVSLRDRDLSATGTLVLVILDTLVDDGWRVGRPPAAHTLATPRILTRPTRMTQHSYWHCLAILQELSQRGVQECLSGKPQQYYCDVLAGHCRGEPPATAPITSGTVRQRSPQQDSDSSADDGAQAAPFSDAPMVLLGQARPVASACVARKKAKRTRARRSACAGRRARHPGCAWILPTRVRRVPAAYLARCYALQHRAQADRQAWRPRATRVLGGLARGRIRLRVAQGAHGAEAVGRRHARVCSTQWSRVTGGLRGSTSAVCVARGMDMLGGACDELCRKRTIFGSVSSRHGSILGSAIMQAQVRQSMTRVVSEIRHDRKLLGMQRLLKTLVASMARGFSTNSLRALP